MKQTLSLLTMLTSKDSWKRQEEKLATGRSVQHGGKRSGMGRFEGFIAGGVTSWLEEGNFENTRTIQQYKEQGKIRSCVEEQWSSTTQGEPEEGKISKALEILLMAVIRLLLILGMFDCVQREFSDRNAVTLQQKRKMTLAALMFQIRILSNHLSLKQSNWQSDKAQKWEAWAK